MSSLHAPKLSVVMAVFNEKDQVAKTIQSILNQDFKDFEFIIIDDGSTDETFSIIERFDDLRIRLFRQKNQGLANSLNNGIGVARAKYIARIDGDDTAYKNRFSLQLNFLENNIGIGMVGSYAKVKDASSGATFIYKPPTDYKNIKICMLRDNPMIHSSLMFRKQAYDKIGGYNPKNKLYEDYDFCIRMADNYQICNLPLVLVTRNVLKDHMKKPIWSKYSKYELYAERLKLQLQAFRKFSFHYMAPVFLLKTALQVLFERVKHGFEKV